MARTLRRSERGNRHPPWKSWNRQHWRWGRRPSVGQWRRTEDSITGYGRILGGRPHQERNDPRIRVGARSCRRKGSGAMHGAGERSSERGVRLLAGLQTTWGRIRLGLEGASKYLLQEKAENSSMQGAVRRRMPNRRSSWSSPHRFSAFSGWDYGGGLPGQEEEKGMGGVYHKPWRSRCTRSATRSGRRTTGAGSDRLAEETPSGISTARRWTRRRGSKSAFFRRREEPRSDHSTRDKPGNVASERGERSNHHPIRRRRIKINRKKGEERQRLSKKGTDESSGGKAKESGDGREEGEAEAKKVQESRKEEAAPEYILREQQREFKQQREPSTASENVTQGPRISTEDVTRTCGGGHESGLPQRGRLRSEGHRQKHHYGEQLPSDSPSPRPTREGERPARARDAGQMHRLVSHRHVTGTRRRLGWTFHCRGNGVFARKLGRGSASGGDPLENAGNRPERHPPSGTAPCQGHRESLWTGLVVPSAWRWSRMAVQRKRDHHGCIRQRKRKRGQSKGQDQERREERSLERETPCGRRDQGDHELKGKRKRKAQRLRSPGCQEERQKRLEEDSEEDREALAPILALLPEKRENSEECMRRAESDPYELVLEAATEEGDIEALLSKAMFQEEDPRMQEEESDGARFEEATLVDAKDDP